MFSDALAKSLPLIGWVSVGVLWLLLQGFVIRQAARVLGFHRRQGVFIALASIFVAALLIANLTGAVLLEPLQAWGLPQLISGGILTFPITFILTDIVNEFYGQSGAKLLTWLGVSVAVLAYLAFKLLDVQPISPHSVLAASTYTAVSGQFTHMLLASLTAFVVGQLLDIALFRYAKQLTGGRLLWLRATGSTVVSQLVDSLVVGFIAFYGTLPVATIFNVLQGNYLVKLAVVIAITPLLYLVQAWVRKELKSA